MKAKKELSTGLALLGFLLPLAVLLTLIFQGVSIMLGLTAAICVEGLFGIYLGYSWDELEESAMKGIGRVNQTVIVMILIGMLIGVWISAGSVQTMLYYGVNLINPKFSCRSLSSSASSPPSSPVPPGAPRARWALH